MAKRSEQLLLIGAALFCTSIAQAQPGMGMGMGGQPPPGMVSPQLRFANAPQVGDMVPDLTIVDRDGAPVNLRELTRENYTVLVLGCLT